MKPALCLLPRPCAQVYKQGGVPAFFRGFQLTLTRAFIMDAGAHGLMHCGTTGLLRLVS